MEDARALFDLIYGGLAKSRVYRAAAARHSGLPEWVAPLSALGREHLVRIAAELRLGRGTPFVDLACGLGGPGLWVVERTGAPLLGIDFSSAATAAASALARERGLDADARFITADACETGLSAASYDALMSVDAIQFMDAGRAVTEIARVLRPGGRAAILTWEALEPLPVPTVERDYRPFFERAGMHVSTYEFVTGARERERAFNAALLACAQDLRAEIGEAAEPILHEAQIMLERADLPPRVRKMLIVAQRS